MDNTDHAQASTKSACRLCGSELNHLILDLGMSPLCQNRIYPHQLNEMEPFYPLRVFFCEECLLVQLEEFVAPQDIFSDYAYFSSYSESWVRHAGKYVEMITSRLSLDEKSRVVELASNDGYLLQHFVKLGIPCLGIEPAENVAAAAVEKGIPTVSRFFGAKAAGEIRAEFGAADLIVGNNVLAHVPDLNDFVAGIKVLLAPTGVVTMEFPHLKQLMENNQFDTIYHEHFSYFSFLTAKDVFSRHGMTVFDVEELRSHGGSLRVFVKHDTDDAKAVQASVGDLLQREIDGGYDRKRVYDAFSGKVRATKRDILHFLVKQKNAGKSIVGYGAPGKGNTLLNYCGIREDFLDYLVDISPHKQGTFTPGTHIPIHHPHRIRETRPDYLFILPWNLTEEIVEQAAWIRDWGGKFIVPIPEVRVLD